MCVYFQLSIETFLQSFLCDVIEQEERPLIPSCQSRFGLSFPGQTSHLLPKGLKGRSVAAQGWDTKRRSAPHRSRCSDAYLLPGPGCRACEGGHGSSTHRLSGCDPGVKNMALLQGTAHPPDRPLGPGLTSRTGRVVFCAAWWAKGVNRVCSYYKRDTQTPRRRPRVLLRLHQQLLAQ